jgi:hypothetical protein
VREGEKERGKVPAVILTMKRSFDGGLPSGRGGGTVGRQGGQARAMKAAARARAARQGTVAAPSMGSKGAGRHLK